MNTLPLELWFKISSYDISIFMAMTKTFSWFRAYVTGKKALFHKTFAKIEETSHGIFWFIGDYRFRQDDLPIFISPYMSSWNNRLQNKPNTIKCLGDLNYHGDKIINRLRHGGHIFHKIKTYFIEINADLTTATINYIDRSEIADNIPSIGMESVVWYKRTDMCKTIEIIFDGSLIYDDNHDNGRKDTFLPIFIDMDGSFGYGL